MTNSQGAHASTHRIHPYIILCLSLHISPPGSPNTDTIIYLDEFHNIYVHYVHFTKNNMMRCLISIFLNGR